MVSVWLTGKFFPTISWVDACLYAVFLTHTSGPYISEDGLSTTPEARHKVWDSINLLAYPFIMLLGYASAIPKTDILYVTLDCSRHIIVGLSQKTQQPHTRSAFWRIRSSNVG